MACFRFLQKGFPSPKPQSSAVLVTGVASGLGRAFAEDLGLQGFLVFGTVRNQTDFDELKAEGKIRPVMLDVTNGSQFPDALAIVTSTLKQEGRTLCALINNAGMSGFDKTRKLEFVGPEHYERVMATNVQGLVRTTEAFLPLLKECSGARIVNIGSYFGSFAPGRPMTAAYVASKFAVEGLTDVWRRSLRTNQISVALVKPGDFSTKMNPTPGASSDLTPVVSCVRQAVMSRHPRARYYAGKVVATGLATSIACRMLNMLPETLMDKLW